MSDANKEVSLYPIEWVDGYGKSSWQPVCGDDQRWWVVDCEGQSGYLWGRENRYKHARADVRSRRAAIRIGNREQHRRIHAGLAKVTRVKEE